MSRQPFTTKGQINEFLDRDQFDRVAKKVVESSGMAGYNTDRFWTGAQMAKDFADAFRELYKEQQADRGES